VFRVRSDTARNRLYLTLAGHLEGPERQEAVKAILAEAGKLAPGFGVISDISDLHASDQEGFRDFLRTKEVLKLRGAGPVVRVVKLPISRIQVERISNDAGFEAESAASVEEADQRLDALQADGPQGTNQDLGRSSEAPT
jgi:hypothetical protein